MKFAQGIAKGVLFTLTNPEAAVRIHWEKYPASKPTNIPEEQALKEAVHVLQARLAKYRLEGGQILASAPSPADEWTSTQNFFFDVGVIKSKPDVGEYYTNELIDQVNSFDKAAIIKQAESYTMSASIRPLIDVLRCSKAIPFSIRDAPASAFGHVTGRRAQAVRLHCWAVRLWQEHVVAHDRRSRNCVERADPDRRRSGVESAPGYRAGVFKARSCCRGEPSSRTYWSLQK